MCVTRKADNPSVKCKEWMLCDIDRSTFLNPRAVYKNEKLEGNEEFMRTVT